MSDTRDLARRRTDASSFGPGRAAAIGPRARASWARARGGSARGRVRAPADEEAVATELEVVAAPAIGAMDARGRRGLVWSLVAGETRVAVRTEHLALAELVRHLLQQREERLADGLVVDVAIRLEPVPGVVGLDAIEPRARGP